MASGFVDTTLFFDMYDRLGVNVQYFSLSKVHDNANPFTKNVFHFQLEDYTFDFKRLLKKPKSNSGSSVSPVPIKKVKLTVQDEDGLDTDSDEFRAALHKLNKALKEENIKAIKSLTRPRNENETSLSEDHIVVCVGNHLISTLAGKAVTSKAKSRLPCPCGCNKKLLAEERMYIGSEKTWYGELDLFALGRQQHIDDNIVGIVAAKNIEKREGDVVTDNEDIQENSQGERRNLEFKKQIEPPPLGQSIVFGWTEYNRHKDLSPYIPFIYIDNKEFLFFIYNPELDSLISSANYIKFLYEKHPADLPKEDMYSGIFILWIILNHRLFFRKKIQGGFHIECGFTRQLSRESKEAYKELKDFAIFVQSKEKNYDQWGHEPQMKRRMPDETS